MASQDSAGGAAGAAAAAAVVPAQLDFMAIYNPSLGTTDETVEDQIVYYGGPATPAAADGGRRRRSSSSSSSSLLSSAAAALPTAHLAPDERNERLRQIGLAQGMVAFGRSFSGDAAVDAIETDKTRVVLQELEPGWWLLASVHLTRLPAVRSGEEAEYEYSSREVKPAALLRQDLLRAHAVFLLHHGASLAALYARATPPRARFTALLARYWDVFLSSWSVLLHGNPVRDVLPGLRMAACGELGIGVGEEDRGSGEREVLEGLVEQVDGLVDLVVCKFGGGADDHDAAGDNSGGDTQAAADDAAWLGTGCAIGAEDGAIFLGVGALARPALRTLTYWMEDIYTWGPDAYGVAHDPSAPPRSARRRAKARPPAMGRISEQQQQQQQQQQQPPPPPPPPFLPPPPVTELARRTKSPPQAAPAAAPSSQAIRDAPTDSASGSSAMDKYMAYVKLGYGTYWSLGSGSSSGGPTEDPSSDGGSISSRGSSSRPPRRRANPSAGRFLIGLVEDEEDSKDGGGGGGAPQERPEERPQEASGDSQPDARPARTAPQPRPPRTVVVEMARSPASRRSSQNTIRDADDAVDGDGDGEGDGSTPQTETLQVVVYARRPFLYALLFRATPPAAAPALSGKALQTLLRRQLSVLHVPLLRSTTYRPPDKPGVAGASAMLSATAAALSSSSAAKRAKGTGSTYDLIWDPGQLTVQSTIPNIPEPKGAALAVAAETGSAERPLVVGKKSRRGSRKDSGAAPAPAQLQRLTPAAPPAPWSRVEALNTHMQLLNVYVATRSSGAELERTCKTSRGWWISWTRIVERGGGTEGKREQDSSDDDEDSDDDDREEERAPSDVGSDDTATLRTAAAAAALGDYTISKEIFLIRKASDYGEGGAGGGAGGNNEAGVGGGGGGGGSDILGLGRASSAMRAFSTSSYLGLGGTSRAAPAAGAREASAGGWAQGLGVDATKRYLEGLLTPSR